MFPWQSPPGAQMCGHTAGREVSCGQAGRAWRWGVEGGGCRTRGAGGVGAVGAGLGQESRSLPILDVG